MGAGSRGARAALAPVLLLGLLRPARLRGGAWEGHEDLHVQATVTRIKQDQTQILDRCFYVDHVYIPYLLEAEGNGTAANYTECQKRCQGTAECSYFTFFAASNECRLAGPEALYERAAGGAASVTGPRSCPKFPSGCTEMPSSGFPGYTPDESKQAWPSHRVPQNMECWPTNWTENQYDTCVTFKVLESTATGWPGKCRGLTMVLIPHLESCESFCRKKLLCSAFQIVQQDRPFGPKTCWHGDGVAGVDCYERHEDQTDFQPLSAKRFMRGNVRVLADLQGVQVRGLFNTFPETYFLHVSDAIKACRYHCYSNLLCQYWQYYLESGCWVEDPVHTGRVPFPPTRQTWIVGSEDARTVVAGEYIQHLCFEGGTPSGQLQHEWKIVANNSICDQATLKNLGGSSGNVTVCKRLTVADAACGNQMETDGWECRCVRKGQVCTPRPGNPGTNIYEHSMVKRVGKAAQSLDEHKEQAEEHGYHKLDKLSHLTGGKQPDKLFHVTLTVQGLRFGRIDAEPKVMLAGRYVNLLAGALRVPSSKILDITKKPSSVSIIKGAGQFETKVGFVASTPPNTTRIRVHRSLVNDTFVAKLEAASREVVPAAVMDTGLRVSVSEQRRGGHMPGYNASMQPQAPAAQDDGIGVHWWKVVLLLLLGILCIGGLMACQQPDALKSFAGFDDSDDGGSTASSLDSDEELSKHRHGTRRGPTSHVYNHRQDLEMVPGSRG